MSSNFTALYWTTGLATFLVCMKIKMAGYLKVHQQLHVLFHQLLQLQKRVNLPIEGKTCWWIFKRWSCSNLPRCSTRRIVDARFMDSVCISVHLDVGFLDARVARLSQEESVIIRVIILPMKRCRVVKDWWSKSLRDGIEYLRRSDEVEATWWIAHLILILLQSFKFFL